jgi:Tol biopolymer transport system component
VPKEEIVMNGPRMLLARLTAAAGVVARLAIEVLMRMRAREHVVIATTLSLVVGLAGAVVAGDAARAHPSAVRTHNGQISFGRFDPALGTTSLWVADAHGGHERRLTAGPASFSDWAPDGRTIAFDFTDEIGDVHLAVIRPDGTGRRTLTSAAGIQEVPSWSPDGTQIAFDAFDPAQPSFSTSIWLMNRDGREQRQVTTAGFDVEPSFAPDGQRIAFARIVDDVNGIEAVYVVNIDGTGLRQVVPPTLGLEHPDWSPDGRWIAFNIGPEDRSRPHAGDVFTVHPDGTGLHVLRPATEHQVFFKPRWSPDGKQFLSGCSDHPGHDQLCTFKSDGRGGVHVVRLAGTQPVNVPAWGPRPRR